MYNLLHAHHDATSPDGELISQLKKLSPNVYQGEILIQNIPEYFLGFHLPKHCVRVNLKSSLAQLGIEAILNHLELNKARKEARLEVLFVSQDPIATAMLDLLEPGSFVCKLFAADDRRLVRSPCYLNRMFTHSDRTGSPLLRFGKKLEHFITLEIIDDRLVVFLPILAGTICYEDTIYGFLPLMSKSLTRPHLKIRKFLSLYQVLEKREPLPENHKILLIKTEPLHIRTVFARVVQDLLPKGLRHTAADILEPTTQESGDIYEFYGNTSEPIQRIPLEFFTLEPYKEHSFFFYRDMLQETLESSEEIFRVFDSAPQGVEKTAMFISKGSELLDLSEDSWIIKPLTSLPDEENVGEIQNYIENEPCFSFLKAMETDFITSQGVFFCRYFPSAWLKGMFLSNYARHYLQRVYFQIPSANHKEFFSNRDRFFLLDLYLAGISVFWADLDSKRLLQYVKRRDKDVGMFVPKYQAEQFAQSYFIGIHGSQLIVGDYDDFLRELLMGMNALSHQFIIPGFPPLTPLAILTGGGSGAMEIANRVATELSILSCGNLISLDTTNRYVEAKMSYDLSALLERQTDFHVDLAIFVIGGMGTDFELLLELISIKTGKKALVPVFLIGPIDYWKSKITALYNINNAVGTIQGSEWVHNCLFCLSSAKAGIEIFSKYLKGVLPIGPEHPVPKEGFVII
ncbi:hypothetical protein C10C_0447 [Chlamydia serpentis]|uniref:Uncharacterized protein n=1 Tax=Chlamydia serpentis TaxID=1967782 RepID=A0A2R8FB06_9CHLA|nr:LOG family protein [Chlamydia serpentis]SPN73613.1 hypothetical protein C10C_0447 [Chlamydia serpentis]